MKFLKLFFSVTALMLSVVSCNNSNPDLPATLSVKLVDAPGDYQNVFVEVVDVMVKYEESDNDDDDSEWESLGIINSGVYDLLELTGGVSLDLINNTEVSSGIIKQIRLVLGENNSVVLEEETEARPLNTPSAQQSGLKVMVNQAIEAGFNYDFILDFDVDKSIVIAGNSENINLKPVLRASLEVNSGTLVGSVFPLGVAIDVTVSNGDVTASTMTNDLGEFQILGLPAGFYTVTITPDADSELSNIILENVEITVGQITTLESINLE
ncbi:DUF4382 domain-containing protein [Winogradskyella wandonensis]|nr:DUF4382 domain-containing protein [Winogradskyella wandonensis]